MYESWVDGAAIGKMLILSLGKTINFEMDKSDVNKLVEEHFEELTIKELEKLQAQQHKEVLREISSDKETEEMFISTTEIKEGNVGESFGLCGEKTS